MAINFPNTPVLDDTYTVGSRTWRWNGTAWILDAFIAPIGYTGSQGNTGDTGPTGPTGPQYGTRVVTIADGTTVTMNADTTDTAIHNNTQTAGTLTMAFGAFKLNGVAGRRVSLQSSTTAGSTIAKSGVGKSENDYLNISYINAATPTTFYAGLHSTSIAGTNTNWVFNFFTKPKVGNALGFFHQCQPQLD